MNFHKIDSLADYVAKLEKDADEAAALRREMLIGVTSFFRDPDSFEALKKKAFPEILKSRSHEDSLRLWIPACSTGEEVYSLAIALLEFLSETGTKLPIQIFGSDISEDALKKARAGIFSASELEGVSDERRRRFFVKTDGGYQVGKTIRDLCIFAEQDLTNDPPFSKLDLISCRNLLIYLDLSLQKKVVSLFHYALKPNGFLMLGTAETVGNWRDIFVIVDKKNKIYSRRSIPHKISTDVIGTFNGGNHAARTPPPHLWGKFDLEKETNRVMIEKFAPPGVIIGENMTIVRFQGAMRPFLDPMTGGASLNLLKMVPDGLVTHLRALIESAAKKWREVRKKGIVFLRDGKAINVDLEVIPLSYSGIEEKYFAVLFHPAEGGPLSPAKEASPVTKKQSQARHLQSELIATKRQIQAIIEAEESANQELRAANEEILSSNEELQSTNEELETAKEELQSTNEELSTINDELNQRNQLLIQTNNDLTNLFVSTDIPIIMLHSDLRIRHFTPMAEKVMHLISGDEGRFISDFKPNIDAPDLEALILESMKTKSLKEREVRDRDGVWYLLQIRPYRTAEGRVDGAVIGLILIDPLKKSLQQLADAYDYSETIIESVSNPLLLLDEEFRVVRANGTFYEAFDAVPETTDRRLVYELGNGRWDVPALKYFLETKLARETESASFELDCGLYGEVRKFMLLNARHVLLKNQNRMVLLSFQDVTLQRESALNMALQYDVVRALAGSSDLSEAAKLILQAVCERFGWRAGQMWTLQDLELIPTFFWGDPSSLDPSFESESRWEGYVLKREPFGTDVQDAEGWAIPELGADFRAEREQLASRFGLQTVLLFLLRHKEKTLGAMEFFSDKVVKIERDLMELVQNLGSQIGLFMEIKSAEKLKQASEEVLRSSKLRQQFAAMTSHELRTPLTAIKEGISLVLEGYSGPLNDEQKENLRISENNVARLGGLINNLLNLTQIDSDQFKMFFAPTHLNALVWDTCESMKQLVDMKGQSLVCELPEEAIHANCDAEKIQQVIVNLVDNAIKFTDRGGEITVRLKRDGVRIAIEVADTGWGIKDEDQRRIFELFERSVIGQKQRGGGFGIGLTICKKIVEQHRGRISVQSKSGEGSLFTVSFPGDLPLSKQEFNGEAG
jgi:chemotaxis methyl-accepting protein methylase/signal transduction histidine kinase/PAS domain-containing protein